MALVLITGCSTGIGRATAEAMSAAGYDVVATARRLQSLEGLSGTKNLQLDVDDDHSVQEAVTAAGEVDILVNNAAWELAGPIELVPLERVHAMFQTNVFGPLRLVQAIVPGMRERGSGTIVNVSSNVGRFALPLSGAYAATKHALEALSEALYYELAHFGIRVRIVQPGGTATAWASNEEWHGVDGPPYDELYRQLYGDRNDDGLTSSEAVAAVIVEAVESDTDRLRWPATPRVERILEARRTMDDAAWESALRAQSGVDW